MTVFGDKLRLPFKMINLSLKCSRTKGAVGGGGGGGGGRQYTLFRLIASQKSICQRR